jgi:sulfite exporter TauE/SafE
MDLLTAFFLGLIGSLHCAGMCGPLALALPRSAGKATRFVAGRFAYNLGRILTYCLLGFCFGLAGKTLLLAGFQRGVSIVLGLMLLAGLVAARKMALWRPITSLVEHLKAPMSRLLRRPGLPSLAMLGLLNGLLPCGLVYVACAGAMATGGILAGVRYMAAFGLGTIPMMLAISLSGALIPPSVRLQWRRAIPVCVFFLGTLLILRGMSLGIPYLSPDLSTPEGASCCPKPN